MSESPSGASMPDLPNIDAALFRVPDPAQLQDVMEELVKFTLLTRDIAPDLVDRYSERKESAAELSARVNQQSI